MRLIQMSETVCLKNSDTLEIDVCKCNELLVHIMSDTRVKLKIDYVFNDKVVDSGYINYSRINILDVSYFHKVMIYGDEESLNDVKIAYDGFLIQ